uniref:DUF4386 domain-containing protein n=1 Tax=uncultured Thiotrichaceae bacterium TaxID=298394 RepID=A0A6S6UM49_9GAMM|nr:MAG: Unknown protein [uncultured Thiotrichaceae bacterium]
MGLIYERKKQVILTGLIGLLAAVLVGVGEFLLHFDPMARFSESDYAFMLAASDARQTWGHFIGVLAAPLYVVGCWHIYLMLKPANQTLAFIAFLLGSYGFMIGADWISSRASIGAITHLQDSKSILQPLVDLYVVRYESLLTVIRITTLLLSLIIIVLVWSGRSHYHKMMAFFNPIVLLLLNFVIYIIAPEIGKYMMPIALNIGFGLFFILSLLQVSRISENKEFL